MSQAQLFAADTAANIPDDIPIAQAATMVETACRKSPVAGASLALMFLNQSRKFKALAEERAKQLEQIASGPWTPGTLIAPVLKDRGVVQAGNRQLGVTVAPEVDRSTLEEGCAVLLNRDLSLIVDLAPAIQRAGLVGRYSRPHGQGVVVLGPADQEVVLRLSAALRKAEFHKGELLLYDADALIALDRIATRHEHAGLLEEVRSDLRITQLGALQEIYQDILEDVLMGFRYREVTDRHQLDAPRSIMLVGPPGVGKTSLIKCVANEISAVAGVGVRLLLVRPSIHRSKWYGESEERVRAIGEEIRRIARQCEDLIFVLLDDVDQLGSRDTANDVDARVLPSLLHEMESLRAVERVFLFSATNRPDLVDPAMLRAGRLGDREYRVPRPGTREASGEILRCYLSGSVPCLAGGCAVEPAEIVESALSAMYAPNGELATLARLFFRDGSTRPLTPSLVVSGSLLKNAAQTAKRRSCSRVVRGGPEGVTAADLVGALAAEFDTITGRLRPGPSLHSLLDLPPDYDVVRVEPRGSQPDRREFVRFAAAD